LLSKSPIKDVFVRNFDTYILRRSVVYATIRGIRYALVHFPFRLDAGVPEPSNVLQPVLAAQILMDGADIIFGDFNSGFGYQPEGYQLLLDNGYIDPFPGVITYCPPELSQDPRCVGIVADQDIDHILFKSKVWKFLQRDIFGDSPDISDHVGVKIKAQFPTDC
jgi:endonuclease/exonuclease/phosphatase family metal-dependent hydrolase